MLVKESLNDVLDTYEYLYALLIFLVKKPFYYDSNFRSVSKLLIVFVGNRKNQ